jgi:ethanolamine ammonia-lyase large subunit
VRERGFDVANGCRPDFAPPPHIEQRLDATYAHARAALYATIDRGVVRDACPHAIEVRTIAADRDDYLNHPATGERISEDDARTLRGQVGGTASAVQIVVSDGLNANAANENLKALLPGLRRALASLPGGSRAQDVVVRNGRVRAGYHIGGLVHADLVVHVIGERPGTGLDTLSAYLTYGRDHSGRLRWDPGLDHSCTNAVCGIHPKGKAPATAIAEIAGLVARMVEQRRSGVALGK